MCDSQIQRRMSTLCDSMPRQPQCRIPYSEMVEGKAKPYLLGEQQRPRCINCAKDELWSHFCQYKSHGPACSQYDQDTLFETLRSR